MKFDIFAVGFVCIFLPGLLSSCAPSGPKITASTEEECLSKGAALVSAGTNTAEEVNSYCVDRFVTFEPCDQNVRDLSKDEVAAISGKFLPDSPFGPTWIFKNQNTSVFLTEVSYIMDRENHQQVAMTNGLGHVVPGSSQRLTGMSADQGLNHYKSIAQIVSGKGCDND